MHDKRFVARATDILWCVVFTVFLFQNPLKASIHLFTYVDDAAAVVAGLYLLWVLIRERRLGKGYWLMIGVMVPMVLLGVVGNVTSGVSRTPVDICSGILYLFKVYVCFIGAALFFERHPHDTRLVDLLAGEVRIISTLAFPCLLLSQIADIGMTRGVRYGISCFKFLYTNPGTMSQYCIIFLLILTVELQHRPLTFWRGFFLLMLVGVWMATCRSRAFVAVAVWLVLCFISRKVTRRDSLQGKNLFRVFFRPQYIVLVAVLAVGIGWSQFETYFGDEVVSARSLLVQGGYAVMRDFFPLGSGFGTYGTGPAASHYSPLYYTYGLNTFWALDEGGSELTDCYWPAVGAELGVIGMVLMGVLILIFLWQMIRLARGRKFAVIAALTYAFYMLISSTATGIFSSYITADFIIVFVAVLSCQERSGLIGNDSSV